MSGVYIPGMEMPKSCYECPFFVKSSSPKYPFVDCKIIGQLGDVFNAISIPIDCPLVSVPDHGRLIDADNLLKSVGSYDPIKWTDEYGQVVLLVNINNEPTIIQADKDGEA